MSLLPQIDLQFADGEYTFALLFPQLVELEEKCGHLDRDGNRHKRGVIAIYSDLLAGLGVQDGQIYALPTEGRASATDCRHVIRLALVGGGSGTVDGSAIKVVPTLAETLCQRYVDTRPIVDRWTLAAAILRAAIEGYDPPKKEEPAAAPAGRSTPKNRSRSRKSSPTAE